MCSKTVTAPAVSATTFCHDGAMSGETMKAVVAITTRSRAMGIQPRMRAGGVFSTRKVMTDLMTAVTIQGKLPKVSCRSICGSAEVEFMVSDWTSRGPCR